MARDHRVRSGDNVMLLAQKVGLFWQTVWDHPNNAELKSLRKDPDVLFPGDILHIPDMEPKTETVATEQKHRFRAKGTPAKFVMKLMHTPVNEDPTESDCADDWQFSEPEPVEAVDEPRADVPFCLYADNKLIAEGQTDADGKIEEVVPPTAKKGKLVLYPGTEKAQTIDLKWGCMDPIEEVVGICKRLNNLGHVCPETDDEDSPHLIAALRDFQRKQGLDLTGAIDDATRAKIQEVYGG